jgi:broad specificity phosphatase PhoE
MPIRVTLLCHAPMPPSGAPAFPADGPADPDGLARAAAMIPARDRIDRLWTAPELRTRQTAAAVGPDAVVEPALRDVDVGVWSGRRLADIRAADPDGAAAWLADMAAAPHGGEPFIAVLDRIGRLLDGHREPGHTVMLTHPAVIRCGVVHALGAPPEAFWRLDVEPLSAADLRRNNGRWTLRSLGRVAP